MEMIAVGSRLYYIDSINRAIKLEGIKDIEILKVSTKERYTGDIILNLNFKYKGKQENLQTILYVNNGAMNLYCRNFGISLADLFDRIIYIIKIYKRKREVTY